MSDQKNLSKEHRMSYFDTNCDNSYCNLKLGFSSKFASKVRNRKLTKCHRRYYMKNIFSSQNGQKIFNKCENQTKLYYGDVLNGTRKTLVTLPPIFQYNSRTSPISNAWESELSDKIKNLQFVDNKELQSIQKYLEYVLPQSSERNIYNALFNCFFNYRGLLVHGYEPSKHLDVFVNQAKQIRTTQTRNNIQVPFMFNQLEQNILESLNIEISEIVSQVNAWVVEIQNQSPGVSTFSGKVLKTELVNIIENKLGPINVIKRAKGKFKEQQQYTQDEIRSILISLSYENAVKPSGEMDFWMAVANLKIMLNIEVKRQMDPSRQAKRNLNKSLHSASKQTSKHAEYMAQVYGPMLSEGWQFLKLAAIFPGELDNDKICPHCQQFIITEGKSIEEQLKKIIALVLQQNNVDIVEGSEDFTNLFQAIVGFSSISTQQLVIGNAWQQIQGETSTLFASGWTKAEIKMTSEEIRFENVLNLPHNIYRFIYFNPNQVMLLENIIPLLIFANDFGAGKTLLSKEAAIRMAQKTEQQRNKTRVNQRMTTLKTESQNQMDEEIGEGTNVPSYVSASTLDETGKDNDEEISQVAMRLLKHSKEIKQFEKQRFYTIREEIAYCEIREKAEKLHRGLRTSQRISKVYYLSLVATDAGSEGRGIPRKVPYWFDVKSEMELEDYGVNFLSAQDLQEFYYERESWKENEEPRNYTDGVNIYTLVQYFILHNSYNTNDVYILDEVPFLKDDRKYTRKSVYDAEEFILKCAKLLGVNPFLWVAFQSNVLCDLADPERNFDQHFPRMIQNLSENYGFFSPSLHLNMRNSCEVGELAQVVNYEGALGYKITEIIDILSTVKSNVTSIKPQIIPIENSELKIRFDDVIKTAINGTKVNVVLYSSKHFDPKKIRASLIKCGVKSEDIFHHSLDTMENTKESMKEFLLNLNGVLICQDECFIGMEACSVVYCVDDFVYRKNLRCHLMRATSDLRVIYSFDKSNNSNIVFGTAPVSSQYIQCEDVMRNAVWICQTCGTNKVICKYCYISCHRGHQAERKFAAYELENDNVKCECGLKSSTCNFNKS